MSKPERNQRPSSMVSETSTAGTTSTLEAKPGPKIVKSSSKVHSFGKRDQAIRRNLNVPVVVRGWLHKQDSSGMRLWKRRWFVLADYCLFYYKDSREEAVLGSIPLPSYVISPVAPEDRISRKYSFKAVHTGMRALIYSTTTAGSQMEHSGMRTYYFSADTLEDMNAWVRAMNQAAQVLSRSSLRRDVDKVERQAMPQANHTDACQECGHVGPGHSRDCPRRGYEDSYGFNRREQEEERFRAQRDPLEGRRDRSKARSPYLPAEEDALFVDLPGGPRGQQAQPQRAEKNGVPPYGLGEQNGTNGYQRTAPPRANPEKHSQRKTGLAQAEHWTKAQKGDGRSLPLDQTLPRQGPSQPLSFPENYQSLPKSTRHLSGSSSPPPRNLPSDYKYAQDRASHLKMSSEERRAHRDGTVWQLYEWQQRQQFRHGSPTAPIGAGSPEFTEQGRSRSLLEVPRSISVPPSPSDIPPPGPPRPFPPRRPHTPAERVTVKPPEQRRSVDISLGGSPRKARGHAAKNSSHVDRRSMPSMGYMTHTVSAPSLHGKSLEELSLLLTRLQRHQSKLASVRNFAVGQLLHHYLTFPACQADDTYLQLKKDLEYLDLKIKNNEPLINVLYKVLKKSARGCRPGRSMTGRDLLKDRSLKPMKIAESDIDVKLSIFCEQDRILQDLEDKIRALKENKDQLESVLEVLHRQTEQYRDQPQHLEKITCQQRLLQEDLVHIRAELCRESTEMENAWNEYLKLEKDVEQLKQTLQEQHRRAFFFQEKSQIQKDLWRIEDVMAGLSANKENYRVLVGSVKNPERKTVPLFPHPSVPSLSPTESKPALQPSPPTSPVRTPLEVRLFPQLQTYVPYRPHPPQLRKVMSPLQSPTKAKPQAEDEAPPRPPLPELYSPEDQPPAVPPLPREATIIRHTSVRGLKRQSDERKRDREQGQCVNGDLKVELRSYVSEPELASLSGDVPQPSLSLVGSESRYQTLPGRGLSGSTSRLQQSSTIAPYVTLRRGLNAENSSATFSRPKSALERLYSGDHQRGKMSAEEQLERMKRHQKALVRERKRTLSQGEKTGLLSARYLSQPLPGDLGSWKREQEFDLQLLERAAQGDRKDKEEGWLKVQATPVMELDLEPQDYDLDISRELSKPEKVSIPERYVELDPEEPPSLEELQARYQKAEKIRNILARSSMCNLQPLGQDRNSLADLDSQLQEQERIINISYALASEASKRSKQVAVQQLALLPPKAPLSSRTVPPYPPLSNGLHYTFV
ncbi:pleckstrin homology domain-containing family A member 7 isoform X1 [Mus musculus]|nr:pleckstrin homology domain-containing family A member 7 isoform X1 [Mus musculus]XP_017177683.1 pleckstrin homology domain-containing family A member 7 isoform X1 [Mus musculus]XP_017177684.1 pleckstrin homology domain-containing family A member 7 isoform X1 [Mus musculus]XP_036008896.1 pleckstrin homology domain-containing family A member 7 isoform X1 [Mus musculus]|eukprot:XP_017177674.1 PREDICTED: pleckstrin homology domain-containing family A member 7 isoform X1 [Mus musculus]